MKEWKILLLLEFEWRMFRINRRILNWLVRGGMKLSSPILCMVNRGVDNFGAALATQKQLYEQITGQIIQYHKRDEI